MQKLLLRIWVVSLPISSTRHIYAAKRNFKSRGKLYLIGSIVEDPMSHYSTRSRIGDEIREVNEQNLTAFSDWILSRTGVDPYDMYEEALVKLRE